MAGEDPAPRTPEADRIGAVNGLRALAVLAVIVFHYSTGWLPGGYLGVNLFFVISGFVITRFLLDELNRTGRVSLRNFWSRRARRLLPSVLLLIVVVQIWVHNTDDTALTKVVRGQALTSLGFVSNWYNIYAKLGYFDASANSSPLSHLWSLSIEEQFYVVWPIVIVLIGMRRRLIPVAVPLLVASATWQVIVGSSGNVNRAYLGTDTRAPAILVGAVLALILVTGDAGAPTGLRTASSRSTRILATTAAALALVAAAVAWRTLPLSSPALFRGGMLASTTAEGLLVAAIVVHRDGLVARILALRLFTYTGERSYALYLWHWPVLVMVTAAATHASGWALGLTRAIILVACAITSYAVIENPIRHSSLTGLRLVRIFSVPTALVAALVITYVPTLSAAQAADQGTQPIISGPGAGLNGLAANGGPLPDGPRGSGDTILVVGDSWARNLGIGMIEVDHRSTVLNLGIGSCGITDAQYFRAAPEGVFPDPAQCLHWQQTWAQAIATWHPQAAVMTVGNWDQAQSEINGKWEAVCDQDFDQRYAHKLDQALDILSQPGVQVFVTTVIDGGNAYLRRLSNCMNTLLITAVQQHPHVHLLNFDGFLCPDHVCPLIRDGTAVYDSTGHLGPVWQQKSATWVLSQIYAFVKVTNIRPRAPALAYGLPLLEEVKSILGNQIRETAATPVAVLAAAAPTLRAGCGPAQRTGVAAVWTNGGSSILGVVCSYTQDGSPNLMAETIILTAKEAGYTVGFHSADNLTQEFDGRILAGIQRSIIIVRTYDGVAVAIIVAPVSAHGERSAMATGMERRASVAG